MVPRCRRVHPNAIDDRINANNASSGQLIICYNQATLEGQRGQPLAGSRRDIRRTTLPGILHRLPFLSQAIDRNQQ
jgi:hypothetical protein